MEDMKKKTRRAPLKLDNSEQALVVHDGNDDHNGIILSDTTMV